MLNLQLTIKTFALSLDFSLNRCDLNRRTDCLAGLKEMHSVHILYVNFVPVEKSFT